MFRSEQSSQLSIIGLPSHCYLLSVSRCSLMAFLNTVRKNGMRMRDWCPVSNGGRLRFTIDDVGFARARCLAVGITSDVEINIWISILIIGAITFLLSTAGIFVGKKAGYLLGNGMEMTGGTVLFALGIKILVEHLVKGI